MNLYKILSIFLACLVLVAGGFYAYERYSKNKTEQELNQQLALLSKTLQETQTAYSRLGVETDNIKIKNKELQEIIAARDEEVVALNEIVLEWKGKYFEILEAYQSIVDGDGNPVPPDPDCVKCYEGKRFKVEFDKTEDYLRVWGYTLTNPANAFVNVEWVKDLKLQVVLARKDKKFRIYVDSSNSDVVPVQLNLRVDSSVFDVKWYERLGFGGNIFVGEGAGFTANAYVQVFDDFLVGPSFVGVYNGDRLLRLFGASIIWFPFR